MRNMGARGGAQEFQRLIQCQGNDHSESEQDCADEDSAEIEIMIRWKGPDARLQSQGSAESLQELANEYRCEAEEKIQVALRLEAQAALLRGQEEEEEKAK